MNAEKQIILAIFEEASTLCPDQSDYPLHYVLEAYESVLLRYGLKPSQDTFYYKLLLRLSRSPEPNWWLRFEAEVKVRMMHRGIQLCC